MTVNNNLEELKKTFIKTSELIKELNQQGCDIAIKITQPSGQTQHCLFIPYSKESSQVNFEITKASINTDLMQETGKW